MKKSQILNRKWKNLKEKTGRDNVIKWIIYIRTDQTRTEEKTVQWDRNRSRVIITLLKICTVGKVKEM